MLYLILILTAVVSYLIGSINSSIILSKAVSGDDIRNSGSGNAGATNMLRTHGKKMGVITLVCDIIKGVIAVAIAAAVVRYINVSVVYTVKEAQLWGAEYSRDFVENVVMSLGYIAGTCAVIGHDFPIFFGFRGGKGVATSLGVLFVWNWHIAAAVLVFAIAVMAVTKYVSLGSILAAAAYVVVVIIKAIAGVPNTAEIICSLIVSVLLIVKHRANIKRLLDGTENKLTKSKG